jgi:hypothetical protein
MARMLPEVGALQYAVDVPSPDEPTQVPVVVAICDAHPVSAAARWAHEPVDH